MVARYDAKDKKKHQPQYCSRNSCRMEEGCGDDEHWEASLQTPGDCLGAHRDHWVAVVTTLDWRRWEIHELGGLEMLERDRCIPNAGRKQQW